MLIWISRVRAKERERATKKFKKKIPNKPVGPLGGTEKKVEQGDPQLGSPLQVEAGEFWKGRSGKTGKAGEKREMGGTTNKDLPGRVARFLGGPGGKKKKGAGKKGQRWGKNGGGKDKKIIILGSKKRKPNITEKEGSKKSPGNVGVGRDYWGRKMGPYNWWEMTPVLLKLPS